MRKCLALAAGFIFMLSLAVPGFAQEDEVISYADKAGITPDSILYPVDVALDDLKVFFTLGDENKVTALTDVAEERLGESEVMLEKGDEEKALELVEEYSQKMQQAYEIVEKVAQENLENQNKVESTNKDTSNEVGQNEPQDAQNTDTEQNTESTEAEQSSPEEGLENPDSQQTPAEEGNSDTDISDDGSTSNENNEPNTIEVRLRLRQENSIRVLNAIKDKLPEQARERIEKVIEMQTEKKEAVAKMVEARHRYNAAKQELKKAEVQLKKAMKTGDQERIAEAQKLVQEKEAVQLQAKEQLNDAITQKKAAVKNRVRNQNNQDNQEENKENNEVDETDQEQPVDENANLNEETNSDEAEKIVNNASDENNSSEANAQQLSQEDEKETGNAKDKSANVNGNGKSLRKTGAIQNEPKGSSSQNSSNASNGKALGRQKQ